MNFNPPKFNESAVIVLIEEVTNSLILTERSLHLRDHPGEICFAGGRWHESDKNLWYTALRELKEELGIEPSRVTLTRSLPIEQTLKGSIIYPWLATIPELSPYCINEEEVTSLLKLPMQEVMLPDNYKDIVVERYGLKIRSCQFTASEYFIWGATARIMRRLCLDAGN